EKVRLVLAGARAVKVSVTARSVVVVSLVSLATTVVGLDGGGFSAPGGLMVTTAVPLAPDGSVTRKTKLSSTLPEPVAVYVTVASVRGGSPCGRSGSPGGTGGGSSTTGPSVPCVGPLPLTIEKVRSSRSGSEPCRVMVIVAVPLVSA